MIFDGRYWLVIAMLIAARLGYWLQVKDEPWFIAPGTDPEFYMGWAQAILDGRGREFIPFPRAPLYPYILAGLIKVFATGGWAARGMNLAAELATVSIVYRLACSVGGRWAALMSGLLYSFCGAAIYFSGELLMTSLAGVLAITLLLTLNRATHSLSKGDWAVAGLVAGVWSQFRPNTALLIPVIFIFIIATHFNRPLSRRGRLAGALIFATAAAGVIAPTTLVNYIHSGDVIPISLQGGVNFYIGNARGASGWASVLPTVGAAWTEPEARQIAERDAGRDLSAAEVSAQFVKMGARDIAAAPGDWLKLMLKKVILLVNIREIANNRPFSLAKGAAPFLKWLFFLSLGAIIPMAAVGMTQSGSSALRNSSLIIAVGYAATLLPFFINARYRFPLIPIVAIWAGVGAVRLAQSPGRQRMTALTVSALLLGVTVPNWFGEVYEQPAQAKLINANALMRVNRLDEAVDAYRSAAVIEPRFPGLNLNWGAALLKMGRYEQARQKLQLEINQNPNSYQAYNNLGIIAEWSGALKDAEQFYRTAIGLLPEFEDAVVNLARILMKMGDTAALAGDWLKAIKHYTESAALRPDDPRPCQRLALVNLERGDTLAALGWAKAAVRRDGDYRPARELRDNLERLKRGKN